MSKKNQTPTPESVASEFATTPESVTLTVTIPRHAVVTLLATTGAKVTRDLATLIENPNAVKHVLNYGIGRFNRDGASPMEWCDTEGDFFPSDRTAEESTLPERHKASNEERAAEAVRLSDAKWSKLLAGTLKAHVGHASVDPLVAECRTLAVIALTKRGVARKAIPKLPDLAAIEAACAAHEGLFAKIRTRAAAVVAARVGEDDL